MAIQDLIGRKNMETTGTLRPGGPHPVSLRGRRGDGPLTGATPGSLPAVGSQAEAGAAHPEARGGGALGGTGLWMSEKAVYPEEAG